MLIYNILCESGTKGRKAVFFLKKGDIAIIAASAAAFIISVLALFVFPKTAGRTVVVKENNAVVYEGSINTDKNIVLENNTVVIKNGEVYMQKADCKNGICKHTGKISAKGETVICLPNRVTVQIK